MSDTLFDTAAVEHAIAQLCAAIQTGATEDNDICLVGIHRGGAVVADRIERELAQQHRILRGNLDISFYRDDLDTIAPNPEVRPSELPFDINGKTIWLIDDVLYTGRTIRAAMGELFDYGRPAAIRLAVLVDRGGRELPIHADAVGLTTRADPRMHVELMHDGAWRVAQRQVKS